jgi:hypothetical protein
MTIAEYEYDANYSENSKKFLLKLHEFLLGIKDGEIESKGGLSARLKLVELVKIGYFEANERTDEFESSDHWWKGNPTEIYSKHDSAAESDKIYTGKSERLDGDLFASMEFRLDLIAVCLGLINFVMNFEKLHDETENTKMFHFGGNSFRFMSCVAYLLVRKARLAKDLQTLESLINHFNQFISAHCTERGKLTKVFEDLNWILELYSSFWLKDVSSDHELAQTVGEIDSLLSSLIALLSDKENICAADDTLKRQFFDEHLLFEADRPSNSPPRLNEFARRLERVLISRDLQTYSGDKSFERLSIERKAKIERSKFTRKLESNLGLSESTLDQINPDTRWRLLIGQGESVLSYLDIKMENNFRDSILELEMQAISFSPEVLDSRCRLNGSQSSVSGTSKPAFVQMSIDQFVGDSRGSKNIMNLSSLMKEKGSGIVKLTPSSLSREDVRSRVFKPGHALPSMSLDEFARMEYQQMMERSSKPSQPQKNEDEDSDEKIYKLREWDEFCENNPRGWGNRNVNRG